MHEFIKAIKERVLVFDGSKGTMLQKAGMKGGECPEEWNASHREEVMEVYRAYREAGSDVIQTNSFQGNRMKLEEYSLGDKTYELNYEAATLARQIMGRHGFVAASIGPLGKLFEPSGELTFDMAYEAFREQVKAVADGGADIINFETFTDVAEMRAALIAAKETVELPVICSMAFESNGRTLMGSDPFTTAVILKSLGADMIGTNCSLGPEHLLEIIKKMSEAGGIYLCAKPNAGLPELVDGQAVYCESPGSFSSLVPEFVKYGVRLIGGCCGTTPEFVSAIKASLEGVEVPKLQYKPEQLVASGVKTLNVGAAKKLNMGYFDASTDSEIASRLKARDMEYVTDMALDAASEGYDAVYINVDAAADDDSLLADVVNTAQGYIREPFILESGKPQALEKALRIYKGKAGFMVEGYDDNVMGSLLKAGKKYGSTVIARELLK